MKGTTSRSPRSTAVFLNRAGTRLSARSADQIIARIAQAAGQDDAVTPHVLRHTFGTDLVRGGTGLVTVTRTPRPRQPRLHQDLHPATDDDMKAAIDRLTVDR